MKTNRDSLIKGCIFFALFCIFSCAIKTFDVSRLGPKGADVGFSALNEAVFKLFPYGQGSFFRTISDILLYGSFCVPAYLAVFGCLQIIRRSSLFKIDSFLWYAGALYVLTIAIYLFFDHVIVVNYRPVLEEGALVPSFPSTHVLFGMVFYYSGDAVLKKQGKSALGSFLKFLAVLLCVFRCVCGVHWFTDVVGSIILSLGLTFFFKAFAFDA